MGLLQYYPGVQTKPGIAPAPWAIQPALTAAPGLWRDAIAWPMFNGLSSVGLARSLPITSSGTPILTSRGRALNSTASDSGIKYDATPINRTTSEITFLAWVIAEEDVYPSTVTTSQIFGNTSANTSGIRAFMLVTAGHIRWRLPQAAGNVDVINQYAYYAGDLLQFVGRLGAGYQTLDLYNARSGNTYRAQTATSASITLSDADYWVASGSGGVPPLLGSTLYAYLQFHRWSDEQIEQNRRDMFEMFRPAPRRILIGVPSGIKTGSSSLTENIAYLFSEAKLGRSTSTTSETINIVKSGFKSGINSTSLPQTISPIEQGLKSGINSTSLPQTISPTELGFKSGIGSILLPQSIAKLDRGIKSGIGSSTAIGNLTYSSSHKKIGINVSNLTESITGSFLWTKLATGTSSLSEGIAFSTADNKGASVKATNSTLNLSLQLTSTGLKIISGNTTLVSAISKNNSDNKIGFGYSTANSSISTFAGDLPSGSVIINLSLALSSQGKKLGLGTTSLVESSNTNLLDTKKVEGISLSPQTLTEIISTQGSKNSSTDLLEHIALAINGSKRGSGDSSLNLTSQELVEGYKQGKSTTDLIEKLSSSITDSYQRTSFSSNADSTLSINITSEGIKIGTSGSGISTTSSTSIVESKIVTGDSLASELIHIEPKIMKISSGGTSIQLNLSTSISSVSATMYSISYISRQSLSDYNSFSRIINLDNIDLQTIFSNVYFKVDDWRNYQYIVDDDIGSNSPIND